jgi:hypothetical protein
MKAFQKIQCTGVFSEAVWILNSLPEPITRQLVLWERYAVRFRWKPWAKPRGRYMHIRTAQPRGSWDIAANQFLLEMAYDRHMHIEFVPGNYDSNPSFKYFVLVIQVGDHSQRDPAMVSVRIVSADIWEGTTITSSSLGFRRRESLVLESLPLIKGAGDADSISLAGYDISVSVQLVTEPNEQPYHLVYLDWEATTALPDMWVGRRALTGSGDGKGRLTKSCNPQNG